MTTRTLANRPDSSFNTQAHLVGNFENGSQEWHDLRATGIGGSEVGTICGFNKWESPFTLWAKKTGRIDAQVEPNEAMEWGNRLEPVVLDKFEDTHSEFTVHRNVGTWAHPERPWQLANPDALFSYTEDTPAGPLEFFGIVEVKTAQYEDAWSDGVPAHYMTQVQWYLQTFGYHRAFVVALFHGNRYREFEVLASEFAQENALAEVERFRDHLLHDVQPDYDGALSTYTTVRAIHPDITDDEIELGDLGMYYQLAEVKYKQAEEEMNEMKSRVLDAMGSAKRGLIEGRWVLTRQARGTGTPYIVSKRG